ncbi:MAG TPA: hydrogenase iron-sulfur subunit [Drouetiella sp.]
MANETKKVITLMCERSVDVSGVLGADGSVSGVDGLHVIKIPCSGMAQPLMIEAALKQGASGVVVCGCQIGDCYYREGNKMIRERLLGNRPPMLKKATDRRRVLALWLSRPQKDRFLAETKEFVKFCAELPAPEPAAPAAKPTPKPAAVASAPGETEVKKPESEKTPAEKAEKAITEAKVIDAAEPKVAGEVVDPAKVDNTKTVVPASEDSNDKDVKVVVDTPPIPEGRGSLDTTDGTSSETKSE